MNIDIEYIRSQFPILSREINSNPLVYLDNAATAQKPLSVLEAINFYYETINSNVHRGIHTLSQLATTEMEDSRAIVKSFINAKKDAEIIFTKGTTEAINLVAAAIDPLVNEGDEIILSTLEHHSNIVPWQFLAQRKGLIIKVIPINDDGELIIEEFENLLTDKTKIVAITHISNALGVINPIEDIIELAHNAGAYVLIDGAQGIVHEKVDVQQLDTDFYVFSAHKMYGPTGIGILYGKEKLLEEMNTYQGGGEMIKEVTFEKTTYADLPFKFEAGTPDISGNIAMRKAVQFIQDIGIDKINKHENEVYKYAEEKLKELDYITVYAENAKNKASAISFNLNLDNVHSSDVGFILDKQGIAVRTGHHCAQPLMARLGVKGTIRASFAIYTIKEEVDKLIEGVKKAYEMLK